MNESQHSNTGTNSNDLIRSYTQMIIQICEWDIDMWASGKPDEMLTRQLTEFLLMCTSHSNRSVGALTLDCWLVFKMLA